MKNTLLALLGFILLSTPLAAAAQQFGDLTYSTDGSAITITGYTGLGGTVNIPDTIAGLPVTTIGGGAFYTQTNLTAVTIPGSVTSIGGGAFGDCYNLTSVTIGNGVTTIGLESFSYCGSLTSVTIPGSVTSIGGYAFIGCYNLTSVTMGNGVTNIGDSAFSNCDYLRGVYFQGNAPSVGDQVFSTASSPVAYYLPGTTGWGATLGDIRAMLWNPSVPFNFTTNNGIITITGYLGPSGPATIPSTINGLPVTSIGIQAFAGDLRLTSITLPGSVTSIGSFAFLYCYSLKGVFLTGNAPSVAWDAFAATGAIVYYLPGTTGWDTTFAGRPTRLWNPLMQTSGPNFGVRPAGFGFNITGTADIPIVVEACTSLGNASWVPLQSLNLTNGTVYFSDLNWTNFPARFYRIRPPLY